MIARHVRRIATPKALLNAAMTGVPTPLKTAAKTTKQVANLQASMAGDPRGADRVAIVRADLAASQARITMLAAETTRADAIKAGQHHARVLQAAGVLTEHETATVIGELELLGRAATAAGDRRHWAWQMRERLRFTAGQRGVIAQILNDDGIGPDAWMDPHA